MSFQTVTRIFAVEPEIVPVLFPALVAAYGEELPDGNQMVRTIGGHWSDTAHTIIRAASLQRGTIVPEPLTDGRVAFRCMWQADLAAEFDANGLQGVAELTEEQFNQLKPEDGV